MTIMAFEYNPTTLSEKGLLARVATSRSRAYVRDRTATALVEQSTGQTENVGNFNKRLFKGSKLFREMNAALAAVTNYHTERTLPWSDAGWRILPNDYYFNYTQTVRLLISELDIASNNFDQAYPQEVAADIVSLKGLANPDDYPPHAIVCRAEVKFMPIPDAGDFRIDVTEEDRQALNDEVNRVLSQASSDIIRRLHRPLAALAERLGEYTGEGEQRWKGSIVTTLTDQMSILRGLNLGNDQHVAAVLDELDSALRSYRHPEAFKHAGPEKRAQAKAKLDSILNKMGM
jgi:hypothetical protein